VRSAWQSDPGLVRENNEDCVLADEENGIFLLADGMGGGPGGEVASDLAVTTAHAALKALLRDQRSEEEIPRLLAESLAAAHSAIFRRTLKEPALEGMGTTLEMAVVRAGRVFICHVGDSRVYLFHRNTLRQVTIDDNYAVFLARSGELPSERIPAGYRHILTQAVGVSQELIPEIHILDTAQGDLLLLCSDGLTEAVSDREIGEVISLHREELAAIPGALVAAANAKGGPDNVSAMVIEPLPMPAAAPPLLLLGTSPRQKG
jgi:PPM family protein phosphatase